MKNPIDKFILCKLCMKEKSPEILPAKYEEISVGFDIEKNIIIWCKRHDTEVAVIKKRLSDFSKN